MKSLYEAEETSSRDARHRSVYGLIFVAVVYIGVLVMVGVAFPLFVEEMLLPRIGPPEDASGSIPDVPEYGHMGEVEDLPTFIRVVYLLSLKLSVPLWWGILAAPILIGGIFEWMVKNDTLKSVVYYVASAGIGLAILVSAGVIIFEVLQAVQPAGGA